jgi:hypothetical protein
VADNRKAIKFRRLRDAEVNLLYKLWQIQYLNQEVASRELLSSRLRITKPHLATTLNRLWSISKTHYVLSEDDGEGGVYYILAEDEIPTFTETAKVLELLIDFPKSARSESRVPYDAFLTSATKATGLKSSEIRNVIRSGEKLGYLKQVTLRGSWICETPRLGYEAGYIRKLSSNFVASEGPNLRAGAKVFSGKSAKRR